MSRSRQTSLAQRFQTSYRVHTAKFPNHGQTFQDPIQTHHHQTHPRHADRISDPDLLLNTSHIDLIHRLFDWAVEYPLAFVVFISSIAVISTFTTSLNSKQHAASPDSDLKKLQFAKSVSRQYMYPIRSIANFCWCPMVRGWTNPMQVPRSRPLK